MRKRLFRNMLLVALLVELLGIIAYSFFQNSVTVEETRAFLRSEAHYAADGYEVAGTAYLESIEQREGDRVTLLDTDGAVLYDSYFDTDTLSSHQERPEFQQALQEGEGYSDRYSEDMRQETLYYALRLEDGKVLRVSTERSSVWQLYWEFRWRFLGMIALTTAFVLLLVSLLSRRMVAPINEIDVRHPRSVPSYPELEPLLERMDELNQQTGQQISALEADVDRKAQEADFRREFTANVSHELKTPLTSISGFAELLKEGLVKEQDIRPFAERIYTEAGRMRSLVDDIITISKLDEGGDFYTKEYTDLYRLCKQTISELEPLAAEKGVGFTLEGGSTTVYGVESILYEMIFNLCDNAVRYNRPGGQVYVTLGQTAGEDGQRPFVRVRDTGIGIPEGDQERVFERFYMVDKSHSRELGGTGLGLAIVKHGAIYHEAEIHLESVLGEGTAISITFPARTAEA